MTREYLSSTLQKYREKFYSFSSGVFYLAKGSDVAMNPEKYGIQIFSKEPFSKKRGYTEAGADEATHLYRYQTGIRLRQEMLFGKECLGPEWYRWIFRLGMFLERSHILRMQKFFCKENPYGDIPRIQAWLKHRGILKT